MGSFSFLWIQLKDALQSAIPVAAEIALVYLILRFAAAVTGTVHHITRPAPKKKPAEGEGEATPPPGPQDAAAVAAAAARGIPQQASGAS